MSEDQQQQDMERVRKHLGELGEHFDSVQIFACRHMPAELDGTATIQMGTGNWFTRYGQIAEWLVKQDERARMKERTEE